MARRKSRQQIEEQAQRINQAIRGRLMRETDPRQRIRLGQRRQRVIDTFEEYTDNIDNYLNRNLGLNWGGRGIEVPRRVYMGLNVP